MRKTVQRREAIQTSYRFLIDPGLERAGACLD